MVTKLKKKIKIKNKKMNNYLTTKMNMKDINN